MRKQDTVHEQRRVEKQRSKSGLKVKISITKDSITKENIYGIIGKDISTEESSIETVKCDLFQSLMEESHEELLPMKMDKEGLITTPWLTKRYKEKNLGVDKGDSLIYVSSPGNKGDSLMSFSIQGCSDAMEGSGGEDYERGSIRNIS